MAHLPPTTAIFSPSVARIAASTAKDWNYVDSWLSAKFHGRTPPPFERNQETLKVLLALAAMNESADEERDLVARADAAALQELTEAPPSAGTAAGTNSTLRDAVLGAVEQHLTREGIVALDAMTSMGRQFGVAYPEPEALARSMLRVQATAFELEQMKARVEILQRFVDQDAARIAELLQQLQGPAYKPSSDLAKQNLEAQRRIKAMAARLPELKERVSSLVSSTTLSHPTVDQIAAEEQGYLKLLAQKQELERQLAYFHGLPSDTELARAELEKLRSQLRHVSQQRDAVFEGLVERESPKKGRR